MTQISAYISEETKGQVDAYARRRGVTKAHLIENALQHYLSVLKEIPEDVLIPTRLVLSDSAAGSLIERLEADEEPTAALKALMAEG
uniref:Ribbon-helix-helix protein CopG domain-containing protein n=1 Tax=uncultured Thiotrichaceae bacterium TaxID=298394 RepID=A0A6S6SKB3_9GAMM|nr:MAG: Unknown protein [uncultured Thiotrichaceae bacterium]